MTTYLGIDASLTRTAFALGVGGVAYHTVIVDTNPKQPMLYRLQALARTAYTVGTRGVHLADGGKLVVALEEPGHMGGKASLAAGTLGMSRGAIVGGLPASGIELHIISVNQVRRDLGVVMVRDHAKESVAIWLRTQGIHVPQHNGRDDSDAADAVALAEWAKRSREGGLVG